MILQVKRIFAAFCKLAEAGGMSFMRQSYICAEWEMEWAGSVMLKNDSVASYSQSFLYTSIRAFMRQSGQQFKDFRLPVVVTSSWCR